MILIFLSRLFTFLSNVSINKGNKLLFHRYDMLSLVLFFVALICWLDPNLRQYFNWLQKDVVWYRTVFAGIAFLPVMVTAFHFQDRKKKGTMWYFGNGYGNIFEDIVRIVAGCDYKTNPKRYLKTSKLIRGVLFFGGLALFYFTRG